MQQPLWLQAVDRTGQFKSSQWCPTIVVIFGVHHGTCWMFTRSSLTEKLIDLETSSHCEKSWATMRHTNDIQHSTYLSRAFANVGKFKNLQANTVFWLFARTERRTKNTVSTEPSNISTFVLSCCPAMLMQWRRPTTQTVQHLLTFLGSQIKFNAWMFLTLFPHQLLNP